MILNHDQFGEMWTIRRGLWDYAIPDFLTEEVLKWHTECSNAHRTYVQRHEMLKSAALYAITEHYKTLAKAPIGTVVEALDDDHIGALKRVQRGQKAYGQIINGLHIAKLIEDGKPGYYRLTDKGRAVLDAWETDDA